jgi:hypothetical protein
MLPDADMTNTELVFLYAICNFVVEKFSLFKVVTIRICITTLILWIRILKIPN